ncbi:MAG: hypothetical protein AB7U82_19250 [Blastocatellales bacterium]
MREEFLKHLWTLTRLRYRLIWAQARTSNGRALLFLSLYLLGGSVALLIALSGLGVAMVDNDLDQSGRVAQWTLALLFINGIGLSLMFGLGTQAAFSEESLRRYPMKVKERFIIRQMIGLLDPIWAFMTFAALGLAAGFSWFGKGSIVLGLPAAALFIAASYLATSGLLSVIGYIMNSRTASAAMGILTLLLATFGPLAVSLLAVSGGERLLRLIERFLQFTPPGAAVMMMIGDGLLAVFGGLTLLLGWIVALAWALKKLESLPPSTETRISGEISWDGFYDQIAGLFGRKYAPFVSKSLRYHLRCNLVRFSLITSPMLVLLGKFLIPGRSAGGEVVITFALFFITSSAISVSMMLNLFGYDGAGIRRYAVLPSTFATALRAGSLASLMLRAVVMLAAVALWMILARTRFDARMLLMILGIVGSSLFLFNALGLWTSVLSPKSADFDAMWNNRLSAGANVVMVCGVVVPYLIAITLSESLDPSDLLSFWWVALLMMVLSVGFYLFSMKMIEPVLNWRRERLVNLIAGARDK